MSERAGILGDKVFALPNAEVWTQHDIFLWKFSITDFQYDARHHDDEQMKKL
jgi:hypothetical protein